MKKRIKLTFAQQLKVCFAVFLFNIVLAHLFRTGWFHNLTWLVYGALFIINPVYPEQWVQFRAYPKKTVTGIRIAGAVCIYIGLAGRFGI